MPCNSHPHKIIQKELSQVFQTVTDCLEYCVITGQINSAYLRSQQREELSGLFLTRIKAEAEVIEIWEEKETNKPITLRLLPPSCCHNCHSSTGNCSLRSVNQPSTCQLKLHLLLAEIPLWEGHHALNERRWVLRWSSLSLTLYLWIQILTYREQRKEKTLIHKCMYLCIAKTLFPFLS